MVAVGQGSQVMRHGDGSWTIAAYADSQHERETPLRVSVDGVQLQPGRIAPLTDEIALTLDDRRYRFFHDAAAEGWKRYT